MTGARFLFMLICMLGIGVPLGIVAGRYAFAWFRDKPVQACLLVLGFGVFGGLLVGIVELLWHKLIP